MNLTKELYTYISVVSKSFYGKQFSLIIQKNGVVDYCSKILEKISELDKSINGLNKISNQSSLFNDSHLKLNNLAQNIKDRLSSLHEEIEIIENTKLKNFSGNNQHKQSFNNVVQVVKSKLFRISEKFKKSLQMQTEIIKNIEDRRLNFTKNHKPIINQKKNPFVYMCLPTDENETKDTSLNTIPNTQTLDINKNVYYQERTSAVEKIERTMHDISGMFSKMAHYVNEAKYMIERIEQNTNDSMNNVEKGFKEVKTYEDGVKSNKALFLKVFFIVVFFSVLYIVFLS